MRFPTSIIIIIILVVPVAVITVISRRNRITDVVYPWHYSIRYVIPAICGKEYNQDEE